MADNTLDFLKKLQQGKIYDYSLSPDENVDNGNAFMSPDAIHTVSKEEFLKQNPDLYIRRDMDKSMQQSADEALASLPTEDKAPTPSPVTPKLAQAVKKAVPMPTAPSVPTEPIKSLSDKLNELVPTNQDNITQPQGVNLAELLAKVKQQEDDGDLVNAQNSRDALLRGIMLTRGANQVGASIAGVAPEKNYLNDVESYANARVTDAEARRKAKADLIEQNLKARNQALGEAKSQADLDRQQFEMGLQKEDQGFQRRNQAIGEMKADYDIQKSQMELGNKKAEQDPNSDISKAARANLQTLQSIGGINTPIDPNSTYDSITKQQGIWGNIISTKMAQDSKQLMAKMHNETMNANNSEKLHSKLVNNMVDDLNYQIKSKRTNIGELQNKLNTSLRLRGLITGLGSGQLTSQDLRELVTGVNNLIGGSQSVNQIEHMDYNTLKRTASEQIGRVMGKPTPAGSPEIENKFFKLIDREEGIIKKQMLNSIDRTLPKHEALKKIDPETYNKVLNNALFEYTDKPEAPRDNLDHLNDSDLDAILKKETGK